MIPIGEPLNENANENGPERVEPTPARKTGEPYCTPSRSTTKMRVSFGLITPPAPRAP